MFLWIQILIPNIFSNHLTMYLLKRIKPLYFFLSLAIGLFVVYVFTPPPQLVVKFPSPYNAGNVIYHDDADTCFVYKADKTACPQDKSKIKPQPLQL